MRNILPKTNENNLKRNQVQSESNNLKTESVVDQYLYSLSKSELIQLLKFYASKTFLNELENLHSNEEKAINQFNKVEKKIQFLTRLDQVLERQSNNTFTHLGALSNRILTKLKQKDKICTNI